MLTGKQIARAVRGFLLLKGALYHVILQQVYSLPLTETESMFCLESCPELQEISNLLEELLNISSEDEREMTIENLTKSPCYVEMENKIDAYLRLCNTKTSKLWSMLLKMIDILCLHIKSQRLGMYL